MEEEAFHLWVWLPIWLLCLGVYLHMGRRIYAKSSGRLDLSGFTPIDVAVALGLITFFLLLTVPRWFLPTDNGEETVSLEGLFHVAVLFGVLVGALLLFLRVRKLYPTVLFGLTSPRLIWKAPLLAFGLLLAAYPLLILLGVITQVWTTEDPQEQELITFFREAASPSEIAAVIIVAVGVAPVAEEVVFRGYLYPVMKRFFGGLPALVFTSAMFAFIHVHVPALLPLFLLACCLVVAYEISGSLAVPILMHMIFNSITLLVVWHQIST